MKITSEVAQKLIDDTEEAILYCAPELGGSLRLVTEILQYLPDGFEVPNRDARPEHERIADGMYRRL